MERKRMDYDTFMEMVRQRKLGVSARQICKNIGISRGMIERWWHKGEDEFLAAREQKISGLEQYREFIVSLLAVYPQIMEQCQASRQHFRNFSVKCLHIWGGREGGSGAVAP